MWCQIIIFDSQSNANLSVKNFYLDLDGRNQTCSEGQTWLQKSRWIKTISFFGKFGQTKIRRRVRSKFLLPEFFSTKLKLSFETLMEEIKLAVTRQYEFEYWDGKKSRAPFGNFRQWAFWCKKNKSGVFEWNIFSQFEKSRLRPRWEKKQPAVTDKHEIEYREKKFIAFLGNSVYQHFDIRNKIDIFSME